MSIEVDKEIRDDYLYVRASGAFTLDGLRGVFAEALDSAARENRKAVLLDVREMAGEMTTLERYEIGVHVAKLQTNPARRVRLAVVGHEPLIDPQRFAETVARNRGAVGKVFTDFDEAIAWIERGD